MVIPWARISPRGQVSEMSPAKSWPALAAFCGPGSQHVIFGNPGYLKFSYLSQTSEASTRQAAQTQTKDFSIRGWMGFQTSYGTITAPTNTGMLMHAHHWRNDVFECWEQSWTLWQCVRKEVKYCVIRELKETPCREEG